MGNDVVIRAEGLGKNYIIGHRATENVPTLRDAVARAASNFARTTRDILSGKLLVSGDEVEEFWALRDVNFEVKRGDVVGIIGRNGAGKSTLLKILSRITEPSEGRVEIRGRVASLLEVGTGFHPELTGRENIFLNGAILGMTRGEIRTKFDEIVAFAEIDKFLDTPVKRYSSGMYVRLAFAVAAHLEPEILIVDEVLAVGDAEFQQKCLGKMQAVSGEGRTVLFVSHNLAIVSALCNNGLLIQSGSCVFDGSVNDTISYYKKHSSSSFQDKRNISLSGNYSLSVDEIDQQTLEIGITEISACVFLHSPIDIEVALNIFLYDEVTRPVGACSIGGLGSENRINLTEGSNKLNLIIELPRLAQGSYHANIEIVDRFKNKLAEFSHVIELHLNPVPDKGCSEVLDQSWGFGSLWMHSGIK